MYMGSADVDGQSAADCESVPTVLRRYHDDVSGIPGPYGEGVPSVSRRGHLAYLHRIRCIRDDPDAEDTRDLATQPLGPSAVLPLGVWNVADMHMAGLQRDQ